jgi:hypothetical protein
VLRLTMHPRLPSGLNAVSSAIMLDRVLAVDPAGTVFLSPDAGRHWEIVPVQWTGKAVAVEAPSRALNPLKVEGNAETVTASADEQAPAAPASAANGPPQPGPTIPLNSGAAPMVPAMLFKLTNDRHAIWVSADGKVWRPRLPPG